LILCPQAKLRARSQSSAGNYAELDCNHHKEASLWWGLASFFAGPFLRLLSSQPTKHDQWRSRGLWLEMNALVCGSLARRVAVKSAVVAMERWHWKAYS